jgi:hypothetical protein
MDFSFDMNAANGSSASQARLARRIKAAALTALAAGLLAGCGAHGPASGTSGVAVPANSYIFVGGPTSGPDAQFFAAAAGGDERQIEQSVAAGAKVDTADSLKRTALFAAAFRNQADTVRFLVGKGADVNARDSLGLSPLHAAVSTGGTDAIQALLESGANINSRGEAGETPLHLAAATGQDAIVDLLLQHGANTRLRDAAGQTPATVAVDNGHRGIAVKIRDWQKAHRVRD